MSFDSFGADREGLQNQGLLCVGFRVVVMVGTLPKTNIAPENRPAMLVSGRVMRFFFGLLLTGTGLVELLDNIFPDRVGN